MVQLNGQKEEVKLLQQTFFSLKMMGCVCDDGTCFCTYPQLPQPGWEDIAFFC